MDKIKSVALTGATGFLGSFILRKLVEIGFKPIVILRAGSDTWRIRDLVDKCTLVTLNAAQDNIDDLMDEYPTDCLINLATNYGRNDSLSSLIKTNVLLPISLLEAGLKNGLKLFINTDSFFAKASFDQEYLKEYTNSKRMLEKLLINFSKGPTIVNLRIEHVYGENDAEEKFFTSIIKRLLLHEKVIKLTSGTQRRDFVYAVDVANAYLSVIKNFTNFNKYEEFEVGTGKSITVKEFVHKLAKAAKSTTHLDFGSLESRPGDIPDSSASIVKLQNIGWTQYFTIDQALDQIIKKEKERFKL